MEHGDPEPNDDEHPKAARVGGAKDKPARSEHSIDEAIWGHPLDSVGGIGLIEGFSEKADLGGVLREICNGRELDREKGKGRQATAKDGQDKPLLRALHFSSHLIMVLTKTLCL
jgi:hypothetical protein